MNRDFSCCIDCKERSIGCHSKCEKYTVALKDYEQKKEERKKYDNRTAEWYQYEGEAKERIRRSHNKIR